MSNFDDINAQDNMEDDIITLTSANGEDIDFIEIAGIAYKDGFYAILQPVELLPEMEDDEALVFKVTRREDGSDKMDLVADDEIIDAVFGEYYRLLDELEEREKNEG